MTAFFSLIWLANEDVGFDQKSGCKNIRGSRVRNLNYGGETFQKKWAAYLVGLLKNSFYCLTSLHTYNKILNVKNIYSKVSNKSGGWYKRGGLRVSKN